MFDDYQRQVLMDYHEKRKNNQLSFNLMHPTAAKLKDACINLCEQGYERRDEKILLNIWGKQPDAGAYRQEIKRRDADEFKPLLNFLNGKTSKTDEKNVELLAWLIDFEPRPFRPGYGYGEIKQPIVSSMAGDNQGSNPIYPKMEPPERQKLKSKSRSIVIGLLALITLTGVTTFFATRKPFQPEAILTGKEKCMYWTGDHYQPIDCNQKLGDTPVYALDIQKVSHFKRITQPDTITANAIGKVWYTKIDGHIEFYTAAGFHPIHLEKRLLPITDYILSKYVHPH